MEISQLEGNKIVSIHEDNSLDQVVPPGNKTEGITPNSITMQNNLA